MPILYSYCHALLYIISGYISYDALGYCVKDPGLTAKAARNVLSTAAARAACIEFQSAGERCLRVMDGCMESSDVLIAVDPNVCPEKESCI